MPSFVIEMLGDGERDLMEHAVKYAADHGYVAEVTLGPGEARDITSVADYVLTDFGTEDGHYRVNLTLWDDEANGAFIHPDGSADVQRVLVDDIWELRIY